MGNRHCFLNYVINPGPPGFVAALLFTKREFLGCTYLEIPADYKENYCTIKAQVLRRTAVNLFALFIKAFLICSTFKLNHYSCNYAFVVFNLLSFTC